MQSKFSLKKLFYFATLVFLLLGVWLRVEDPSIRTFWGDEAWRAQQILHAESYRELQAGKYYGMEMPVQFGEYLLGQVGLSLFGTGELAFRFWSLSASLLSLLLIALLGSRFLSPGALALVVLISATSPGFLEHTLEFKPYAVEMLCTLVLTGLFITHQSHVHTSLLAATFAVSCIFGTTWIFFPFIPVFLAIHFRLLPLAHKSIVLASSIPALLGIYHFVSFRLAVTNRGVERFWSEFYLDSLEKVAQAVTQHIPSTIHWYFFPWIEESLLLSIITFVLFALGLWSVGNQRLVWCLLTPLLTMGVLALLGKYPFFTRVSSFYYPLFLFGMVLGLQFLIRDHLTQTLTFTVIVLFGLSQAHIQSNPGVTRRLQSITPFIQRIDSAPSSIPVFVNYQASLALAFYLPEKTFVNRFQELSTPKISDKQKTCQTVENALTAGETVLLFAIDRVDGFEHTRQCCRESSLCRVKEAKTTGQSYLFELKRKGNLEKRESL